MLNDLCEKEREMHQMNWLENQNKKLQYYSKQQQKQTQKTNAHSLKNKLNKMTVIQNLDHWELSSSQQNLSHPSLLCTAPAHTYRHTHTHTHHTHTHARAHARTHARTHAHNKRTHSHSVIIHEHFSCCSPVSGRICCL